MVLRRGREARGGELRKIVQHDGAGYGERVPIPGAGELPGAGLEARAGEIEVDCFRGGVDLGFDRNGGRGGGWIVRNQSPVLDAWDELPVLRLNGNGNGRFQSNGEMFRRFERERRSGRIRNAKRPKERRFGVGKRGRGAAAETRGA